MSRETDSPSSGPNGRGGAAYPSGTPPYGTPMASDGGPDAGRSAAEPDGPKTETTLTTRIRINIPGSRPIPPVVLRTPVADTESAETTGTHARPGTGGDGRTPGAPMSNGAAEPSAESPGQPGEKTSDWFAPRKSGAPNGGPGGGASNGAGLPGVSGPAPAGARPGGPNGTGPAGASPPRVPGGVGSSGSRPGLGVMGAAGNAGGPRAAGGGSGGGTKGAGLGGATGAGPVAPGHGGGTGSFDVSALAAGAAPSSPGTSAYPSPGSSRSQGGPGAAAGAPDGRGEPRRDDLPYFSDNGQGGQNGLNGQIGQGGPNGQGGQSNGFSPQNDFTAPNDFGDFADFGGPNGQNGQNSQNGQNGQNGFGGPGGPGGRRPAGPTGGPVTGDGPVVPPFVGDGTMAPGVSGTGGFAAGLSDDTAILTPQKHVPDPGADGYGGYGGSVDNVSSSTLTSGMPVVPTDRNSPFAPGTHSVGPLPHTPPKLPEPVSPSTPAAAAPKGKKAKKKGRSKLTLLFVAVFLVAGGAYGAGLLMNHSDVPKGTTVFGVDIGGGTRDDAVKKLDDAFDARMTQSLKLSVDGKTVELKPDQAGLQFDTQATVRAAAGSDYNPVSVIGSLFGQQRVVEPVMPVDEEKLAAALQRVAGGASSASDGTIKFVSGKAVAVYGKAGKGIDAAAAAESVENAYRSQVESGTSTPVQVPTKTQEPTISNAEVDRMMKKFAIPAMSANVTVRADTATAGLELSPKNSLWKFLQVKAVNGTLVEAYDKEALKELYGGFFSQVLIPRGNGNKTPVTVEDVIGALRPALVSTTDRVGVIDTNPS
ncbi:hypothetical protein [Streptomyces sp. SID12501]|uniref:Peptidoglycan binding domain-containing protein n=1 Tax=Streptomyces sp. SID12501 TaxID=2706042 RepID=A0A6B3BT40_9ACTN|nr:hypothetical protein [Streptomyces sp. SID12501]NEC87506.1 hypothetical protein [Streptomyces sp. SID12501]